MRYQERRAVVGSAVAGGLNSSELSRVKPAQEPISRKQIAWTLALTDFGLVLALAPVAYAATSWNGSLTGFSAQLPLVLLAAVLTVSLCGQAGTYEPRKVNRPGMTVLRATLSWVRRRCPSLRSELSADRWSLGGRPGLPVGSARFWFPCPEPVSSFRRSLPDGPWRGGWENGWRSSAIP